MDNELGNPPEAPGDNFGGCGIDREVAKLRRAAKESLLVARSSSSLAVGAIGAGCRIIPWERGCPHPLFSLLGGGRPARPL